MNVAKVLDVGCWLRGPKNQWCLRTEDGYPPLFSERYGYRDVRRYLGLLVLKRNDANPERQPRVIAWLKIFGFRIFHFHIGDAPKGTL